MGRVRRPALARSPDPARSHVRARHESARDGARQDGVFLATSLAAPRVLRLTGIAQRSDSTLGPGGPRTSYEGFGRSIVPCVAHGGGVTPRGSGFVRDTGWQGSSEGLFVLRTLEGPLVKRLRFHDDRWWASSDNDSPENGSRPLDGDDGIIGRVVWWAHRIVEGPQPASE